MTAEVWADCLHVDCSSCGVPSGDYCVFHINAQRYVRHAPCIARVRAAEKAAS